MKQWVIAAADCGYGYGGVCGEDAAVAAASYTHNLCF